MKTLIAFSTLLASSAIAAPTLYEAGGLSGAGVALGLKVGADFSQPFNDLGTSPAVELEVGWLLPPLDRSLEIFVAGQWAAPSGEGSLPADPRLPGDGIAEYTIDQQQARLSLGVLYRVPLDSSVRPYVSAGGRLWLLQTTSDTTAGGEDFGTFTEESTEFGVFGALGGEWHTSAGALVFEVQGGFAGYDRTIFEESSVGTLSVSIGWRVFL